MSDCCRLEPLLCTHTSSHRQEQTSHTYTHSNTREVSLGLDKQMCTRASGMRRPASRSLERLSPWKACTCTQTNRHTGGRGRVVSRSAAAPTPAPPAHLQHQCCVKATVTLPRTGSQMEIRGSLKAPRALSGVLRGRAREFCSLNRVGNVIP